MIVHLNETEICKALIEFIGNQGYPVDDKKVQVTLKAGRGKTGHSAQLEFADRDVGSGPALASVESEVDDGQQAIKFDFQEAEAPE